MSPGNRDSEGTDLATAVRAVGAEARRGLDDHPSTETLLAYHERRLPDAEVESLRDHLALCPDCARAVLDLAAFAAPEEDAPAAVPAEWEEIRGVLEEEGRLAKSAPRVVPFRRPRRFAMPRFAYAMAAAAVLFFATTLTLTYQLVETRQALAQLDRPRPNPVLVDLQPEGSALQRDESALPPLATTDAPVVLILNLLDPGSYPAYRVEILELSEAGKTVWTSDEPMPSTDRFFSVLLPRRLLPGERYQVRLSGLAGTEESLLATYVLRFERRLDPRES